MVARCTTPRPLAACLAWIACLASVACLASIACLGSASAQDPWSGPRRNAALEAYREQEARRQAAVAEQLYQNDLQRAQAANAIVLYRPLTPYYAYPGGYARATAHPSGYTASYFFVDPYSGYGYPLLYSPYTSPYAGLTATAFGQSPAHAPAIRQPIGRRELQTGPNRWESFPIYGDEEELNPLPSFELPPLPDHVDPAPPAPPSPGPREF
jgi:hypothetical protein